jgi:5'(3')-deoxyribonucleotidase
MNKKPIIYLDMDGVSTQFVTKAIKVNGKDPEKIINKWDNSHRGNYAVDEIMGITRENFWKNIHQHGEDFWRDLEEYPWFQELYEKLNDITEVVFLTTPTNFGYCLEGKLKWLKDRFGGEFNNYIFTFHKHFIADDKSLLIDDYDGNIENFEKWGGKGVLFPQIWNKNHEIEDGVEYTLEQVNEWYERVK